MSRVAAGKPVAAWGTFLCLLGLVALATPLPAQSQGMVQPLPPAGVEPLNVALTRLARNSRDLDALIDAGNASLQLNDIDAAIGFFGRADELSPGNPRVKVGLAGAFVRSERPIEALRLFDEAERAGASTAALAEERGLAYDLVGDPVSAQAQYARAMAVRSSDELVRRMALSQAIAGDRAGFEKTLLPLLERRDLSAYRTRAFALAILGDEREAVTIAEAIMPGEASARMTPYLRYMKRLTKAQQAAAGNLGIFPRAAQIGRDDPRIAQYAGATSAATPVRTADAGLAPQGQPLGPAKVDKSASSRRADRGRATAQKAEKPAVPAANTRLAGTRMTSNTIKQPAPVPTLRTELPAVQQVPATDTPRPGFGPVEPASAASAAPTTAPIITESVAVVQQIPAAITLPEPTPTLAPTPVPEPASVADAFAGFTLESVAPDKSGAVDISALKPRREVAVKPDPKPKPEVKPEAKPEPPKHPSRVWVQVATGRDRKALAFDWRRISRKAPEILGAKAKNPVKPYVASWGQTSRLLAGPFDSEKAAQAAVSSLKAEGIDSFTFTSSAGEEVTDLP